MTRTTRVILVIIQYYKLFGCIITLKLLRVIGILLFVRFQKKILYNSFISIDFYV